ncbi:MAG TPA: hypothetical protein VFB28_03240 [Terriglobales bacterium]|nr:hypothetical protein [Terriglobales bacterium]
MVSRTIGGAKPATVRGWRCGACGELITRIEDGRVEWLAYEDRSGNTRVKGLRLVHRHAASPRGNHRYGCQYDPRREFRRDRSIVEGLPLARFVGPDGLMLLLSFLALDEMPKDDILELVKRVQIPRYERARDLLKRRSASRVVVPVIRPGYYLQSELNALLRWAAHSAG